jgi:hypothetical protein
MTGKAKEFDEAEDITAIQPEILIEDEQPNIEVQGERSNYGFQINIIYIIKGWVPRTAIIQN